ncbi:MAG: serine hydrolase [Gemmatimonadota bacterium]
MADGAKPGRTALGLMCGLFAFGWGCGAAPTVPIEVEPEPPRDTAPVQGLEMGRLFRLVDALEAGRHGPVHGLIIQRRGEVVVEEYFRGHKDTSLHSVQSVTKSYASALIGIAIANGDLQGVEEEVLDFFPQWRDELATDPRRAAMQLEDVLTMRTGNDYHEEGADAPHWALNRLATGWDYFWLTRPMVRDPGSFWQYDSGGVIALSSILKERTGMHADEYADRYLFGPLGVANRTWFANDEGHPHTGGGLSMTLSDMVKLGQLYLQGGEWEGEQIVPRAWVDASTQRQVDFGLPASSSRRLRWYGYLWWIMSPDPAGERVVDMYAAVGAGGQFVFVIPEHDMVVGVTSSVRDGDQWAPVTWLYSQILPAVIE